MKRYVLILALLISCDHVVRPDSGPDIVADAWGDAEVSMPDTADAIIRWCGLSRQWSPDVGACVCRPSWTELENGDCVCHNTHVGACGGF
jgi:hypothetical protein